MITVGIVIFPDVEELDFVAPFEVLSYVNKLQPNSTRVLLIAPTLDPIKAYNGLRVLPDTTFEACPKLDILLFPGGKGRTQWMKEPRIQSFIHTQKTELTYLVSVCTGAFFLAEAGLLVNKKATTYHSAFEELKHYGVEVISQKVVHDGMIITAGGVSSGLELGFYLLAHLFGEAMAMNVAQKIEYSIDIPSLLTI